MWIVSNQAALQLEVLPEVMEALKEAGATKVRRNCWGRKWLKKYGCFRYFRIWDWLSNSIETCFLDFSFACQNQGFLFQWFTKLVPTTTCTRRPLPCSSMAVCVVVVTSLKQWHWEHRQATLSFSLQGLQGVPLHGSEGWAETFTQLWHDAMFAW